MSIEKYFPYKEFRKGQRDAIKFILDVFQENSIGLLHAPTGIGKTVAAITSYLALLDTNPDAKLVVLTRTKSQSYMYIRELDRIREKMSVSIAYVTFRSKRDMCLLARRSKKLISLPYHSFLKACEVLKRRNKCPFFRRSYDKGIPSETLISASREAMSVGASYTNIIRISSKYGVCPYEVARYLASQSNIVIGSYSYVFNPDIREKFLSNINETLKSIYLVVDEAHNLPDYILSALSLSMSIKTLEGARKELERINHEDADYLINLLETITKKIREIGSRELSGKSKGPKIIDPKEISSLYTRRDYLGLKEIGERIIEESGEFSTRLIWISDFLEYFKLLSDLREFITIIEQKRYDKRDIDYVVSLQLLDPSNESRLIFREIKSAVLMSGSLYPLNYFEKILGLSDSPEIKNRLRELIIPFPFDPDSFTILVDRVCTTKYDMRTDEMFDRIARRLEAIAESIHNKAILVVFPSYEILRLMTFRISISDRNIIIETPKTEIEKVLSTLREKPDSIIFSVAGGKLMEGIDYRLDNETVLAAVVLVGLPFPEWNDVLKAQEKYFSEKLGRNEGRFLTIIAPTVRKTLQAGGRLIRDYNDRGLVIILDKRFSDYNYWKYFPPWWRRFRTFSRSTELKGIISRIMENWLLFSE